ncbi:unnamed protein product [Cuscuta campestris]|uniref:Uncharacterized protein n=1 Tax=Cuscuta campestris TaxID=132261 RepID=A0A484KYU1_9ASTE|nr:unnamed protein product [Cuscuta campestris]
MNSCFARRILSRLRETPRRDGALESVGTGSGETSLKKSVENVASNFEQFVSRTLSAQIGQQNHGTSLGSLASETIDNLMKFLAQSLPRTLQSQ